MSLSQRCGSSFALPIKLRGRQYYDERKVAVIERGEELVVLKVQGAENSCHVELTWASDQPVVTARCSCLRPGETRLCKHLWAAFLEIDRLKLAATIPPRGTVRIQVQPLANAPAKPGVVPNDAGAAPSASPQAPAPTSPTQKSPRPEPPAAVAPVKPARETQVASPPARAASPAGPPLWKSRLQHVLHGLQLERNRQSEPRSLTDTAALRQLWYILDIEQSTAERRPVVAYFQRYRSAPDKAWGPYQSIALDRETIHRWVDPQDREILELLVGDDTDVVKSGIDSEISSSRWFVSRKYGAAIPRVAYGLLLPKLCATERLLSVVSAKRPESFLAAKKLEWDGDAPYQIEFRMLEDRTKKAWEVRTEAIRGDERIALSRLQSIDRGELALIDGRIVRLQRNAASQWASWLGNEAFRVPFTDGAAFLTEILRFPESPPIALPPELQWEQVEAKPQCLVKVTPETPARARKVQLRISTKFVYGGVELPPHAGDSAVVDPQERRILKRNPRYEREALAELLEKQGLKELMRDTTSDVPDYWCDPKQLEAVTQGALRAGWEVIAEGRLVRQASSSRLSVTSHMDWFELEGGLDFGGQEVRLPAILAAIRKGQTFVALGDGSQGMLPAAWLAKFGLLADLADRGDEAMRFLPSQALLLDSLLEASDQQQMQIDERFAAWRERLRSFRGFTPHSAPAGFRGQLRPYQEMGLGWLHGLRQLELGGCLADDMGLGKTVQVLALLESRRLLHAERPELRAPSLVVAPKSLVFNWAEEAKRFTPDLRVLNFTGIERDSLRDRLHEFDLVLTTYGTLRRDVADLKDIQFDYAILDEAQAIKNAASLSAKSCRLLRARHRLAMTGTPIENHLGELWSLFEFINPGMLGISSAFQRLAKATRGGDSAKEAKAPEDARVALAQSLRPFILRRTKQQVLNELPERTEQTLFCEMEPPQRALYDEMKNHYRAQLLTKVEAQGLAKSKIHVLEALLRLRQTACHPALLDPKHAKVGSAKLDTLLDQLEELVAENHKALIFSQFTSLLALVRDRLDAEKIRYEYLDGSTSNRADCVHRFQNDPKIPLFLISLKAGGQGLNLTAADYVFILDPWWNPAVEAQAVDRAYRMGQTRHVFAYRLICRDTIEDKILELQQQKRSLADAILTEDNSVLRDLTADDLDRLLS